MMKGWKLAAFGLVVFFFCVSVMPVSGIAAEPKKYVVSWNADPQAGMNPFLLREQTDYLYLCFMYEPMLVNLTAGGELPWLAKSWKYDPDKATWTFNLDEKAKWSDGKPVTAEDVKYTFEAAYKAEVSFAGWTKAFVKSIEAKDAKTVVFTLSKPMAAFASLAGSIPIMPKHIFSSVPDVGKFENNNPVGSGPFKFKEFKQRTFLHLVKNENYWKGPVDIDELIIRVFANKQAETVALKKGEVDFMPDLAGAENLIPTLKGDKNVTVNMGRNSNMFYVAPNHRMDIMKNKNFRTALDFAADKKKIVKVALAGYGELPLMGYVAPVVTLWANPKVTWKGLTMTDADRLKKANAILDDMGWKKGTDGFRTTDDGKKVAFTLHSIDDPAFIRTAEMLAADWAKIGVKVEVQVSDRKTLLAGTVFSGKRNDAWQAFLWRSSMRADPDHVAREWAPEPPNPWDNAPAYGWENPLIQGLLQKSRSVMDPTERIDLIKKIQEMYADELPVITLAHKYMGFAFRKDRFNRSVAEDVYLPWQPMVYVSTMKAIKK